MSKERWKKIVQKNINETDTMEIREACKTSSKCKNLPNTDDNRKYIETLESTDAKTILIEKLNMTDVKINYKGSYTTYECRVCRKAEENTSHLINCLDLGAIDDNINNIHLTLKENCVAMLPEKLKSLAQFIRLKLSNRDKLMSNTASVTSIDEDN